MCGSERLPVRPPLPPQMGALGGGGQQVPAAAAEPPRAQQGGGSAGGKRRNRGARLGALIKHEEQACSEGGDEVGWLPGGWRRTRESTPETACFSWHCAASPPSTHVLPPTTPPRAALAAPAAHH